MDVSDWLVALFCFAAGVGVALFWIVRIARGLVRYDETMKLHLVAEYITAAALIAGGVATLATPRGPITLVLVGAAMGLLTYAAVQSPAFYPNELGTRALLWTTLAGTLAAFGLRVATL